MSSATPSESSSFRSAPLLVLAAIGFVSVTTELLPAGLLPEIRSDFGVSESQAGLLTAVYAAVIVVSVLPLVRLTSRVPRRTLLLTLLVTFAVSNVLVAASPVFAVAVGARVLGGVAHGMLWAMMAPFVARIVPPHRVGRAMAVVFSGNTLGLALGAPLGTALGQAIGWRAAFVVLGAVALVLGALLVMLVPPVAALAKQAGAPIRDAARRPGVLIIAIAWPLLLMAHFTFFTYIASYLIGEGFPSAATGPALFVVGVAGLAGIWVAGLTVDPMPRRAVIVSSIVLAAAFVLLGVVGANPIAAFVLLALWGASFSAIGIFNQAAILRAGGPLAEAANSITVVTIQLGIAIGALYGGAAVNTFGVGAVPVAAAVPVALSLALILVGRRHAYPRGPRG